MRDHPPTQRVHAVGVAVEQRLQRATIATRRPGREVGVVVTQTAPRCRGCPWCRCCRCPRRVERSTACSCSGCDCSSDRRARRGTATTAAAIASRNTSATHTHVIPLPASRCGSPRLRWTRCRAWSGRRSRARRRPLGIGANGGERRAHRARGRISTGGVACHTPVHDVVERVRYVGALRTDRGADVVSRAIAVGDVGVTAERRTAAEHLVEQEAERVDVGARGRSGVR